MKYIKSHILFILLILVTYGGAVADTTTSTIISQDFSSFSDCMILTVPSMPRREDYESDDAFMLTWLEMHQVQAATCLQLFNDLNSNAQATPTSLPTIINSTTSLSN